MTTSISLSLSPWDAAIILKEDGSFETSLPQIQGDYIPEHVLLGAALAYALRNEGMCTLIREHFEQECLAQKAFVS
jgi:hypothetical protein